MNEPLSTDDHRKEQTGSGNSSAWMIAIVVAFAVYLLSLGPVAALVRMSVIPTSQTNVKILETVYAPVFAVIDRVKFVENFYDAWVAVCEKAMSIMMP